MSDESADRAQVETGCSCDLISRRLGTIIGIMAPGFPVSDRGIVSEFWASLTMRRDFVPDLVRTPRSETPAGSACWGGLNPAPLASRPWPAYSNPRMILKVRGCFQ